MDKRKKKPFNETTTGKILEKAGVLIPELVKMVGGPITDSVVDAIVGKTDEALQADPDNLELQKLRQEIQMKELAMRSEAAQQAHLERMKEMELSTQENIAMIGDVQSARDREIDRIKQTGKRDWMMGAVIIFVMILTCIVIYSLIKVKIPDENKDLAYMAFGMIMSAFMSIVGYYVGSSVGSKRKEQALITKKG